MRSMSDWYDATLEEHRVILDLVDSLKRYAAYLESGGKPHPKLLHEILDVIEHYADKCHHRKEEAVLFPLIRNKPTKDRTMVDLLLLEHEQARAFVRIMRKGGKDDLLRGAHGYDSLLIGHVEKENPFFKECDGLCTDRERGELLKGCLKVESEVMGTKEHAHYREIVENLKKEAMKLEIRPAK
jgi:hemerythrin-like domain-containing protein